MVYFLSNGVILAIILTLAKALDRYLRTVSCDKKSESQEIYRVNTIKKNLIANKPVNKITSVDIANYRDARLLTKKSNGSYISTNTVRLELALLSHLYTVGIAEWGFKNFNPVLPVRKPKSGRARERRPTTSELRKIHRVASRYNSGEVANIIGLAVESAMRQGELLALEWENTDLTNGVAYLPDTKNGESRSVPLSKKARDILSSIPGERKGRVFSYTSNGLKSAWRKIIKICDIKDLHFHDLRHEAISRFSELNVLNVMEISAISGHKSLQMLKRYTHLNAVDIARKLDKVSAPEKGIKKFALSFKPYPAEINKTDEGCFIRFNDLPELKVFDQIESAAISKASGLLLKEIFKIISTNKKLPKPSVTRANNMMLIDPLIGIN